MPKNPFKEKTLQQDSSLTQEYASLTNIYSFFEIPFYMAGSNKKN
jgi:hypothetical protein